MTLRTFIQAILLGLNGLPALLHHQTSRPSRRSRDSASCDYVSANLSRYLDTDLRGAAATRVSAHLHGCLSCRGEFEAMRAQQAIFSALPVPSGAGAARDRVLRRLEAEAGSGRKTSHVRQVSPVLMVRYLAVVAAFVAAVAAAGIAFVGARPVARQPVASATASSRGVLSAPRQKPLPLPAGDEMAALFALHDRQSVTNRKALASSPASGLTGQSAKSSTGSSRRRKPRSAAEQNTPKDSLAKLMSPSASDSIVLDQGGKSSSTAENLAADDVPEAL